jgi:membrane-associated phospholipid phosphatase
MAVNRLAPAELVAAAFNLLLAAVWLSQPPTNHSAAWATLHGAGAVVPFLCGGFGTRGGLAATLRDVHPLLWFALFWSSLGALHAGPDLATRDAAVAALDQFIFGAPLNVRWVEAMPLTWLSEAMHLAYVSYYGMVILLPLGFALSGNRRALRSVVLRLTTTFAICFAIYIALPVLGPARTLSAWEGPLTEAALYRLSHFLHANGDASGTAFPSSHVAASLAGAIAAWRHCRTRLMAWVIALVAALIMLSTVYTGNHYPVDVVAGIATALLAHTTVVPFLVRLCRPRRAGATRPAIAPVTDGSAG